MDCPTCTRTEMCSRCTYERTGVRVVAGSMPVGPLIVPGTRTLFDVAADTVTDDGQRAYAARIAATEPRHAARIRRRLAAQ
jgi:hypothetical protein